MTEPWRHKYIRPAVRMTVVHVWAYTEGGTDHGFFPVVALASGPKGDPYFEPIITDNTEDRRIGPAASILNGEFEEWHPVACPWPESQDEERLKPIIQRLTDELKGRQRDKGTQA